MNARIALVLVLLLLLGSIQQASAGPLAYAACQTACNLGAVKCYSLAGFTFGVNPAVGGGAAVACSIVQGTCMAACTASLLAPTP